MNKSDYLHRFKEIYQHLIEAKKHSTQPIVLDNIEKARGILWVVADDIGIELCEEGD